jgi:CO/xanthine dehydrogenase FAD-binding subunit
MPALKEEVHKGLEEGIPIHFLTSPLGAEKKGSKVTLKCQKMELGPPDESGRPRPVPIKGSEFSTDYDAVMKAIGEEPDTAIMPKEFLTEKGRIKIDESTYALGKNVFAGGDFTSGPATVVAAIAAGRKAASSINRYLKGSEDEDHEPINQPGRLNAEYLNKTKRGEIEEKSVAARIKGLNIEEAGGLELEAVNLEANRCMNCGCVAVNPSDTAPALIVLNAKVVTTKRTIEAEKFFAVGIDKNTILDDDEIIKEVEIPEPAAGIKCAFTKFALRKSIDFPVLNCAAAIESAGGKVKSARICLNSVYGEPVRVTTAEQQITGKRVTEAMAGEAAKAGLAKAFPLLNNEYKIYVAKTLVKRAILACVRQTE